MSTNQIYSKKIIKFIHEIKSIIKDVLSKEIGLKVRDERFYNKSLSCSYPIKVVIYNNANMLGYFESEFYELGFHEQLLHTNREHLHNIIRHELAHYMAFINYGSGIQSHGVEFREFCRHMGWGEEIYKATYCLDEGVGIPVIEESSVLRKVQKLMALASSNNIHEAEQAMIKSQQLLLRHNIDSAHLNNDPEEKVVLKRVLKEKKSSAKMHSIANILSTFFVNTVFSRQGDFTFLEIVGSSVNVDIADYVANFLYLELEKIWNHTKKQHLELKGMIAKNSFFRGIAKGYCNKIQSHKKHYHSGDLNALIVIENQLIEANKLVYPRLSKSTSSAHYCSYSAILGEAVGKQLTIRPGVNGSTQNSGTYLS